jgi:hypothetical protein
MPGWVLLSFGNSLPSSVPCRNVQFKHRFCSCVRLSSIASKLRSTLAWFHKTNHGYLMSVRKLLSCWHSYALPVSMSCRDICHQRAYKFFIFLSDMSGWLCVHWWLKRLWKTPSRLRTRLFLSSRQHHSPAKPMSERFLQQQARRFIGIGMHLVSCWLFLRE